MPKVAAQWLVDGYDSPLLREMASLTSRQALEGEVCLAEVLAELGHPIRKVDSPYEQLPWRGQWEGIWWAVDRMDRTHRALCVGAVRPRDHRRLRRSLGAWRRRGLDGDAPGLGRESRPAARDRRADPWASPRASRRRRASARAAGGTARLTSLANRMPSRPLRFVTTYLPRRRSRSRQFGRSTVAPWVGAWAGGSSRSSRVVRRPARKSCAALRVTSLR